MDMFCLGATYHRKCSQQYQLPLQLLFSPSYEGSKVRFKKKKRNSSNVFHHQHAGLIRDCVGLISFCHVIMWQICSIPSSMVRTSIVLVRSSGSYQFSPRRTMVVSLCFLQLKIEQNSSLNLSLAFTLTFFIETSFFLTILVTGGPRVKGNLLMVLITFGSSDEHTCLETI